MFHADQRRIYNESVFYLLVGRRLVYVEVEEDQLYQLVRLADEIVQDAVDLVRQRLGKVGRRERPVRPAAADVHDAGAGWARARVRACVWDTETASK